MSAKKFKTRSSWYFKKMNDKVKEKISAVSKESGIAQWLIVEKILEESLNISSEDTIDVSKWLGIKNLNKVGKSRNVKKG